MSDVNSIENSLENRALIQLNATHYKEAIELYRELVAVSDNDQWLKQLAYCYIQRALLFAARGMIKEALVLWETHCQYTKPPYEGYDHYMVWLIEVNDQVKLQACLEQLSARQLDKKYPKFAAILGLLMLTKYPEYQSFLPDDSIFIKHFNYAKAALDACQNNNQATFSESLKHLPFRSAFRDFRIVLNAMVMPTDIEKLQPLLAKVPHNSPYRQVAKLVVASNLRGSLLADALLGFNSKQRRAIGQVKGLKNNQLELIDQLFQLKDHLTDKVKFNLAIQYKSLCGKEIAKQYCQELLVTYPAGLREYNKKFASIDEFEENRLNALICERDRNAYEAELFWKKCIQILIREEADNRLKIALILRHLVKLQDDEETIALIIESLDYDPDDRDCYLQILDFYSKQRGASKDYKIWLDKAVEKFPEDIDVLTLAINLAKEKKSYKKASQYALNLLKIDPLNSFAKQILFLSYLAYTRLLIKEKQFQLVENEILKAEKLNLGKAHILQIQLMRGLFCFFEHDKQQGLQWIVDSLNQLNSDPLNATFQATMEAQLTGVPVTILLKEMPSAKDYLLSYQELTQFIQQLKAYIEVGDSRELLHKSLFKIKPSLKKSLLLAEVNEKQLLNLCLLLDKIDHFELLRHCAKIALAQWENPIWTFYQVYSEANGIPEQCQQIKIMHLELAREQAMKDKCHRAVVLIDNFLDRYYQVHPERNRGFIDDFLVAGVDRAADKNNDDPLALLFGHITENRLLKLDTKLESLLRTTTPELLVEQLKPELGDNNNIMSAMMHDADLFTALLMHRAATELDMDIGVSIDNILECFGVDKQADKF